MNLHRLQGPPPPALAQSLAVFEAQFTYPLGPGRSFRISHGDDYPRFFRAIGEAACFVAERDSVVLGTLGTALCRLTLPGGEERRVIYLGDLKIAPVARSGAVLMRLVREAWSWVNDRADGAFAVVMDGTAVTPEKYTGRIGIPPFRAIGKIIVLRVVLPTSPAASSEEIGPLRCPVVSDDQGMASYRRLSVQRYFGPGGTPSERSEVAPIWLVHRDGSACGRLEDTRRAKRLVADDGKEMISAHLSCFAFADPRAGGELLRAALLRAASLGFPALFAAVAEPEAAAIRGALTNVEVVPAPATVYGAGLEPNPLWNINTAEI